MGKKNVPKAIGHVHDDRQSRQDRATAEHKEKKRLAGVHTLMRMREDAGGLSGNAWEKEQERQALQRKREEKERRAKTFLDHYVDPEVLVAEASESPTKCTYYSRPGGCRHGDRCKFLHDGVDGRSLIGGAGGCVADEQTLGLQEMALSDEAAEQRLDGLLEKCAASGVLSEVQCDALTDAIAEARLTVRACLREWDEHGTLDRLARQL
mmetsp:Transcript_23105/g.57043  ORF Transcript_23105/g.57043 Transcript_23105/m.57043 type:complete len:209 (-) Transcript_23105:84-710(-)